MRLGILRGALRHCGDAESARVRDTNDRCGGSRGNDLVAVRTLPRTHLASELDEHPDRNPARARSTCPARRPFAVSFGACLKTHQFKRSTLANLETNDCGHFSCSARLGVECSADSTPGSLEWLSEGEPVALPVQHAELSESPRLADRRALNVCTLLQQFRVQRVGVSDIQIR